MTSHKKLISLLALCAWLFVGSAHAQLIRKEMIEAAAFNSTVHAYVAIDNQWVNPDPTNVQAALDYLVTRVIAIETTGGSFCADAGSTDAYACNLAPAITAYVTGTRYRFKPNTPNTGAATLALNSLAATTIKKAIGSLTVDLSTGDIIAGQWVDVVYNGTNFQLQSPVAAPQRFYNANAASTGIWVCDDAVPTNCGYIYYSASLGLQFVCAPGLVENACDYIRKLAAGKLWGTSDRNGTNIFTVTENNGSGIVKMVLGSDATGDIWYRDSSGNMTRLGIGGANTVLHGGTIPAYSAVNLAADVTGTLPAASVGTSVKPIYLDAGAFSADGTNCVNPSERTINSGQKNLDDAVRRQQ